jgi:hypothetical protein
LSADTSFSVVQLVPQVMRKVSTNLEYSLKDLEIPQVLAESRQSAAKAPLAGIMTGGLPREQARGRARLLRVGRRQWGDFGHRTSARL